jgi:hypothetical protein
MNVKPLVVKSPRVIDEDAIRIVEEMLEGMKAGRVSAMVVVAKEDTFSRWSCIRAYTNADRYNLIGQLHFVIHDLVEMTEE